MSTSVCTNTKGQTAHGRIWYHLAVLPGFKHRASDVAGTSFLAWICSRLFNTKKAQACQVLWSPAEHTILNLNTWLLQCRVLFCSLFQLISSGDLYLPVWKTTPHQLLRSSSAASSSLFIYPLVQEKRVVIKYVPIEDRLTVMEKLVFFC